MTIEAQLVICLALALAVLTAATPKGRHLARVFAAGFRESFRDPVPPIAIGVLAGVLGLGIRGSLLALAAYLVGESRARRGDRK